MQGEHGETGRHFWRWWTFESLVGFVLASALGWALSFAASGTIMAVGSRVTEPILPALGTVWFLDGLVAGGAVFGTITGIAVDRLLSRRVSGSYDEPAHV